MGEQHADQSPMTLPYSDRQHKGWSSRRTLRRLTGCLIILVALLLISSSVTFWTERLFCDRCGAHSIRSYWDVLGMRGGERLVVHEGPVSVILQADAGIKCAHNWRLASCFGKGIRGYSGVGHFLDQDTIVSVLESTNGFSVPTVPPARKCIH